MAISLANPFRLTIFWNRSNATFSTKEGTAVFSDGTVQIWQGRGCHDAVTIYQSMLRF